jgi:hypothetical protein
MKGTGWMAVALSSAVLLSGAVAWAGPIHTRQECQHARIAQGVRNGSLTPGEVRRLAYEQRDIRRDRRTALADGRIGPAEARHLTRDQNRAGRDIYRLKHNGRTVNP